MIADSQTSASFESAIRYTTTEKNAQIRRDDLGRVAKIAAEAGVYNGRVSTVEARNVFREDDPMEAAREMQVTADLSGRVQKPVYSISISYQVADDPTDEEMIEDMGTFLERRGLGEHQAVYAVHRDTDNPHVHATVNRVHPRSKELWRDSFDYYENMKALRQIERERGWSTPERDERRGRVPDWKIQKFDRLGEELFSTRVLEEAGNVFAEAESWKELQLGLSEKGLTVKEKGSGGIVTDGQEEAPLSELARMWSFSRLDEGFPDGFRREREIRQAQREEEVDPLEEALTPDGPPPGEMSDSDLEKNARELTQSLEKDRDHLATYRWIAHEDLHRWHMELKEERLEKLREEMQERGLSPNLLVYPLPEEMTFEELIRERVERLDDQGERYIEKKRYNEVVEEIRGRDQAWTAGQKEVVDQLDRWRAIKESREEEASYEEKASFEEMYRALDEAKRGFEKLKGFEKRDLKDALDDGDSLERALDPGRSNADQARLFDLLFEAMSAEGVQVYDWLDEAEEKYGGLSKTEQEEVWEKASDAAEKYLKAALDPGRPRGEPAKVAVPLKRARNASGKQLHDYLDEAQEAHEGFSAEQQEGIWGILSDGEAALLKKAIDPDRSRASSRERSQDRGRDRGRDRGGMTR